MFFDSHVHLNFDAFKEDYQKVISHCLEENIWMINAGADYETSCRAVEIAATYEKGVWAAVGMHPTRAEEEKFEEQRYLELAKNPKVVAIGETGLDYAVFVREQSERIQKRASAEAESEGGLQKIKEKQKDIFKKQIELALTLDKPLIIHCRDAHQDIIDILNSYFLIHNSKLKVVIHCFSGNLEQAEKYLEMGFCLGFTGIITYADSYDEIIRKIPFDKILIETDCPYLAPVPCRGKRNEPIYVKYTAQKIAAIKNISLEETAEQTFQNAIKFFGVV